MRNASVVHRHNACSKRHFPVYNGSLDAHNSSTGPPGKGTASNLVLLSNVSRWYHPEGHAMTFVRGGVQTSPACSGGTCPCCSLCHETIAAIDAQLRWTSKSKELRDRLTNPWVCRVSPPAAGLRAFGACLASAASTPRRCVEAPRTASCSLQRMALDLIIDRP